MFFHKDPSSAYNNPVWQDLLSDESQYDDIPMYRSGTHT
jgi:hypothetical protein